MQLGPRVILDGRPVLTGSCSWTDRTLVQEADWYPRRTMGAEERLAFYAARLPLVEIDSTYYAPPSEQQARLWARRTPEGFRFDVKAYSLLTGHPTRPRSLWPDLREQLVPTATEKPNVYARHLPSDAREEAWRRFGAALVPLREAGRLGCVLFQYPPWFLAGRENRREVETLPERLPGYRICVEFRSPTWLATERDRKRTLGMLGDAGLIHVGVDAPRVSRLPRVLATTCPELLVVRFHGRSDATWQANVATAAERFRYLYSRQELAELAGPLARAAARALETHLLMNNCYRDYAVRNAVELRDVLAALPGAALR